jgi:hypothetical protein
MDKFFKIFGWIMAALFLTSSILQYNDPDPLLWVLIYSVASVVSIFFALGRISFLIPLLFGILALVGGYLSFPAKFEGFEIGAGDIKNIEEGREAVGLILISLIMFAFAVRTRLGGKS